MSKLRGILGYFDCRQYKADVPRQNRKMIAAGGRINFSAGFTDEELPEEIKPFANKSEKSGLNYVNFKVFTSNCKLYTASAKLIPFDFEKYEMDGGKFEVNMDISIKHGDPKKMELNGCYCNAMQIIRRADNPFDAVEGGDDSWVSGEVVPEEVNGKDPVLDEDEGSLPF